MCIMISLCLSFYRLTWPRGRAQVLVPLHHPPSGGQPSPVSSPRLCITSAEKSLQPNPLSSHWLNTHGHKQGQEKKKVWIFMNYLHFPWRKMQQQDGVTVWAGSCSQGHARQVHSQETQLALSVIQPHNHSYCASSAHIIWTNASSRRSFCLSNDITASVSTSGLDWG